MSQLRRLRRTVCRLTALNIALSVITLYLHHQTVQGIRSHQDSIESFQKVLRELNEDSDRRMEELDRMKKKDKQYEGSV